MKGFPKHIATKQDFINLLNDKRYKDQAIIELEKIYNLDDLKATKATILIDSEDPEKGYNTEEIDNPMPLWKQKGFGSREEITELLEESK